MVGGMENVMHLDLHCLIARFAPLRLHDPHKLRTLVQSIEHNGQLVPVIAVADEQEHLRWVLIDGYRRLEALRALGEDQIWVDVWDRGVDEALLVCLARAPERAWEAIEQAALIQELTQRHSLRQIALSVGHDVSWVSRRLSLFKALPEDLLEQVRQGRISLWAATRILAPLARANEAHARTLLAQLENQPLSTRELKCLYSQYQQANKAQRERLVQNPGLFLQALQRKQEAGDDRQLAEGPEGAWRQDLVVVRQILKRLIRQVPTLFAAQQDRLESQRLLQAFASMKSQFQRLDKALEEVRAHDSL